MIPYQQSYWQKPEGIFNILFTLLLTISGGYALYHFLPYLILWAQNALYLSSMLIVSAAAIFMFFDPKVRTLLWYMYKNFSRWVASLFVEMNPLMIINDRLNTFEKKLVVIRTQKGKLGIQKNKLYELIINNEKEIAQNLVLADQAKAANEQSTLMIKTRRAGRLQDSNMRLDELYKKMDNLYQVINRMHNNAKIVLEDTRDMVKIKTEEQKAIQTSHGAIQNAMEMIRGSDKSQMYEMAMDNLTSDISLKMGEMDQFMQLSDKFMQSIDLKNGVLQEEGLEMLDNWEKQNISLLDSKIESMEIKTNVKEAIPIEDEPENQYESLFK
jgi:hypothetical protein